MQRNRFDQNPLTWLLVALAFIPYEALAMRHLYLPPMLGVLFFLYLKALDTRKSLPFFAILIMLLVVETSKGFVPLSTLLFFTVSYFLVLPKFKSVVSCPLCLNAFIVAYSYIGYWAVALLFSHMFAFPPPLLDYRVIFYIAIEFFLVGLL